MGSRITIIKYGNLNSLPFPFPWSTMHAIAKSCREINYKLVSTQPLIAFVCKQCQQRTRAFHVAMSSKNAVVHFSSFELNTKFV